MKQDEELHKQDKSGIGYALFQPALVVGPTQYMILIYLKSRPASTLDELKKNPSIASSATAIYKLQQNGLAYSKRELGKKSPSKWYLTRLGEEFLNSWGELKKFDSWQDWIRYKRGFSPKSKILPLPTIEKNENCRHSSPLPNGTCLFCKEVI